MREVADTEHEGNLSEAIRALLAEAVAARHERLNGSADVFSPEQQADMDAAAVYRALRARIAELETAGKGLSISLDAVRRRLAEVEAEPPGADVERLRKAGQHLAEILRAGSTGNLTGTQLGALEQWETACAGPQRTRAGRSYRRVVR